MDKWILYVGTNCAEAGKEQEFCDWYDNIHLPDVLETPGFIRATRYENPEAKDGEARYIAIYEIATDDIDAFMKLNQQNLAKKQEAGRFTPLLKIVNRGLYRQIGELNN